MFSVVGINRIKSFQLTRTKEPMERKKILDSLVTPLLQYGILSGYTRGNVNTLSSWKLGSQVVRCVVMKENKTVFFFFFLSF